jgi:hypothetical protein
VFYFSTSFSVRSVDQYARADQQSVNVQVDWMLLLHRVTALVLVLRVDENFAMPKSKPSTFPPLGSKTEPNEEKASSGMTLDPTRPDRARVRKARRLSR